MNVITERTKEIIEREERFASYTTRVPYYPLVVERAKGCIVEDIEGNTFLDFFSSAAVLNTGHNHPKVMERVLEQAGRFLHYTPAAMYHKPHTDLAEQIISITPGDFPKRIAFGLSGASSVDGAIKAARCFTGRSHIISYFRSYHGATMGAISVSGYGGMHRGIGALVPDVDFIPYPDCYRCPFGQSCESCGLECFASLENLLSTIVSPAEVAAVIYEPIQGDGGILTPPERYMRRLNDLCRENGILLIADEIQTGFGRTGKMFASEYYGFAPDILVMGKAIASGMPLSAMVARSEILESWSVPVHFINGAGNPVSCAAGLATIEVLKEENLAQNALDQGGYIMERFREMKQKYDFIGDVRGLGLLIGVDIVEDRAAKTRDKIRTAKICWRCWENGLILAFFSGNILRIAPPLTLTRAEAKRAMDIIESAIDDVDKGLVPDSVLDQIKGW